MEVAGVDQRTRLLLVYCIKKSSAYDVSPDLYYAGLVNDDILMDIHK